MAFSPDARQREAIEHVHGPMLVLAGAGTGKTTVLVQRVVRLIQAGHARPDEILAVTFTDNAAAELNQRVTRELGAKAAGLHASTFHAYCLRLLQQSGKAFQPLDNIDAFVYLRRRIAELALKHFIRAASPGQFLNDLLVFFDRCEDELVTADDYQGYVRRLLSGEHPLPRVAKSKQAGELGREEVLARCEEIAAVFRQVVRLLQEDNLGTYGQMISRAVRLLEADAALLAEARRRARFILIDEFQDSNVAQIRLARLLAGAEQDVFAVGDPDQAIYRFRGATTGAFDQFQRHFPSARCVWLERNRRSLSPILKCAFQVIDQNPPVMRDGRRLRGELASAREEEMRAAGKLVFTEPVEMVRTSGNGAEAADIANTIADTRRRCAGHEEADKKGRSSLRPCRLRDFAVLYRQHSHRDALIREFTARGIGFSVKGVSVIDSPQVRDALAALRAIATPSDGISLFRLAALPEFAIDCERLRELLAGAGDDASMASLLQKLSGGEQLLRRLDEAARLARGAGMRAVKVLDIALQLFAIPAAAPPLIAFGKFVAGWEKKPITQTGRLAEFLEYLQYFLEGGGAVHALDGNDDEDGVQLMTVHAAKGLEFPHVIVIRATSGSFPAGYREPLFEFPQALRDPLTVHEGDSRRVHEEEERRLFYVAMTRARDTLALYGRRGRGREVNPAGFLRSLARARPPAGVLRLRDAELPPAADEDHERPVSAVGSWLELPPRGNLEHLALSATRIETYETCPLKYKIETDWKLPGEPVPAMHFGNAVHTALRAYYDAVRAGRPLARDAFLRCFEDALAAFPFDDRLQRSLFERQGREQLGSFYDLRQSEPQPEVIATEKVFELAIGDLGVRGRIDRADRCASGIVITDYKTGSPRTDEDAEESLQLSIYALAAQHLWGGLPARLLFYNLETNLAVETSRTPQQVQEVKDRVVSVAASIRAGEFRARRGYWCRWCAYREICPATEERLFAMTTAAIA